MSKTVYPVAGAYLAGVPAVPLSVTAAEAKRLLRTGAFTDVMPDGEAVEPSEMPEGYLETVLGFYDPPPDAAFTPTEDPADAGSLDSPEV